MISEQRSGSVRPVCLGEESIAVLPDRRYVRLKAPEFKEECFELVLGFGSKSLEFININVVVGNIGRTVA